MTTTTTPTKTVIRMPEVMNKTGLSRSSIYRRMTDSGFPKPVPLSDSAARSAPIGFYLDEVEAWIEERNKARNPSAA